MAADDKNERSAACARADQVGKVFVVVAHLVRKCLVCEELFTRRSASECDGSLHARNQNATWEEMMQIGDPLRTIIVEPLELPVEEPTAEPRPEPTHAPEPEPEQVPATP